ncbi:MAG: peptidase [Conexibacter sp.]|nr:peptidase [Solirubrobacterales bacterium]MCW3004790.1 peptidase [Conexibacter sp.]
MLDTRVYDLPKNFVQAHLRVEEQSAPLKCWFNPTTLQRSRAATWISEEGIDGGVALTYGGGKEEALDLDLLLHAQDDVAQRTPGDVRGMIDALFALLNPVISGGQLPQKRPPRVNFVWGSYVSFDAAVQSVQVTQELFDADGTPIRATVKLKLRQAKPEPGQGVAKGQNPTTRAADVRYAHLVVAGDSLPLIAHRHLGSATRWPEIAELNQIDDPTRLTPGRSLQIQKRERT